MNLPGMPAFGDQSRSAKACVAVACLIAVTACSLPPTTGTGTMTPGTSAAISTGAALPSSTPGPTVDLTPPSSSSQTPTTTATAPIPTFPAGTAPVVTLNGPFGSVDRDPSPPGVDWPDASGLQALDTWVHSAPLTLTLVDPDLTFAAWTISVIAAVSPTSTAPLEAAPYPPSNPELLRITGPRTGDWLLRAEVSSTGGAAASYFWHLTVPDRDPPADGHVVVPAPHALLATAGARVTGVPGSGCYVGACSDIGQAPPARALEQLASTSGGALTLSLSDGSRFVRSNVGARPIHDTATGPTILERSRDSAGVDHATFAAPGSGDWYVTISIAFDLRRGSYTWYTRLIIP
jgi:hypothetical protein